MLFPNRHISSHSSVPNIGRIPCSSRTASQIRPNGHSGFASSRSPATKNSFPAFPSPRAPARHSARGRTACVYPISPCSPAAIRFTSSKKRLRPIRRNASPPPIPAHDTTSKCVFCKRPSLHYFAERRWTHELKQKRHYKNNTVKWQRISDGNGKIIKNNI